MSGYNSASTGTNALPQSTVTYYDSSFIENLKQWLFFIRCSERLPLPMNRGNKLELFMYTTFGANTSQVSEGTVGSGITPTVLTTTATIGQYADYVSLSDLAMQTALDDAVTNLRDEIAYRAALSLNTIHRNTVDTGYLIDSSVNGLNKAYNSPIVKTDFVNAAQSLLGRAVKPFDEASGTIAGLIHPFCVGDAFNDAALNSITDIAKRQPETAQALYELPGEETGSAFDIGGVRFMQCQLVTQTSNYQGHTGVTAFRTYFFGKDATFGISLGAKEGAKVGDGTWKNITTNIVKNPPVTAADPAGVIGGWTSYNLKYVPSLGPDTTMRYRTIDAPSNVV